MVSSSASFLVPFLLVLLSSIIAPSLAIPASDINNLCSGSRDATFCLSFLKSDPRFASAADLAGVAQVAVEIGSAKATDTLNFVKEMAKKSTERRPREIYLTCSENYDNAVSSFADAKAYMSSKDFAGAGYAVSAVLDDADTCNEETEGADPSLPQRNQNVESICSLILYINTKL
ncbi:hypothetical protein Tsubulata_025946 [Turnera subulata]|uniref:Pectinesterase inhibitor domain-containing protein n=1 Tax=Turnera subulata TaxID=218843 RepID=A0A9Q0G5P3_9ROSI|nr:hypothetical protein Tsubulata_025946 [Turnera subulata]